MKSLAAILVEQKKPLVLEEIEIPSPGFGQVLVKVLCSGVCGSQIGEIDGVKGPDRFLPHLLGHEGTGEVIETGEGVATVRNGDRVVLHWRKGDGLECVPPQYESARGIINAGWITTFNEYALISENRMTVIPPHFDIEAAAMMGCAVTTGFGVINNDAQLKIGQSIVVFGVGGLGLSVIQAAAMVSAYPIIAVDLYDPKLDLAEKLGASHVINSTKEGIEVRVREIVGEDTVDVTVDNTGNVQVIEKAYSLTSSAGRTVLVGVPPKGKKVSIYTLPLHFKKVIIGSHGGEARPDQDIPRYVRLCEAGGLSVKEMISKRFSLEQVNDAIREMREGKIAGRCIVRMTEAIVNDE